MITKIAIISDLHLHHWDRVNYQNPVVTVRASLEKEKPDIILDAGDYERETDWGIPTYRIPGNHDYYGDIWKESNWMDATKQFKFNDLNIVMTTLWTDLNRNDPVAKNVYRLCLADCHAIQGFSPDKAYQAHSKQKAWLLNEARDEHIDIVVTHHVPSFRSVHPRYKTQGPNYEINYGFASDLDSLIEQINPAYWIHGHTHDPYNYMHGSTWVICNPCGYPSERGNRPYEPFYIER